MGWTMVFLLGMLIVKTDLLESGASITCQAEADQVGGEGYVLCRFAFDLSHDPNVVSFTVEHMAPMSKAEDSKQLLDCTHLRKDRKKMNCTRLPAGYDSYIISGSEVVINMSNVGQQHAGQYNCLLLYDGKEIPPAICKLKINGSIPDLPSTTLPNEESSKGVSSDSGIGTGGIIGIVAVLVVIGAITAVLIRRKPCNRGTADNAELPVQDGVSRTGERNGNGGIAREEAEPSRARLESMREVIPKGRVRKAATHIQQRTANDEAVPSPERNITTGSARTKGPAEGPEVEVPPEESVEDHGPSAEKDPLMFGATGGKPESHQGQAMEDPEEEAGAEDEEDKGKEEEKKQEETPLFSS